ncbi:hypothetical protein [Bradyrhizobium sp. UFLA05-112]
MPQSTWKSISEAKRGLGSLLLRDGAGLSDPVYVGRQADDGRWFFGDQETHPQFYTHVPPFDCEDGSGQ